MRHKIKKVWAFLLAVVLCLTAAVPFTVFAGNTDSDFNSLQEAVDTYESKMSSITSDLQNGELFSGLGTAYAQYLHAVALLNEHEEFPDYTDPDLDAGEEAVALNVATAAISKWVEGTFDAKAYHYDDETTGYYSNLVYTSGAGTTVWGDAVSGICYLTFEAATPSVVVMVYDGMNDASFPIVLGTKCNSGKSQKILAVYPNVDNSPNFEFQSNWSGVSTTGKSNWPPNNLESSDAFGYSIYNVLATSNNQTNTGTERYWYNRIYYTGKGNTTDYYESFSSISFDVYASYSSTNSTTENAFSTDGTYYVINYAAVVDNMKEKSEAVGDALANSDNGIAGYQQGGLYEILEAIDAFGDSSLNPNNYDYESDLAYAIGLCTENIREVCDKYENAAVGAHDDDATEDDISALKSAIDAYETKMKDVISALSDGTVYTNLSDAYDLYIKACSIYNSYIYAGNTRVNAAEVAELLELATNVMEVWSPATYDAKVYHCNDDTVGGYSNVLWSSGSETNNTTNRSGNAVGSDSFMEIGHEQYKFAVPDTVVYIYDGINDVYGPVVLETLCTKSWGSSQDEYIYTVYPTDEFTDLFDLQSSWLGWTDNSENSDAYLYWPGTTVTSDSYTDTIYYQYIEDSTYSTEVQSNGDHHRFWWNKIYYVGTGNTDTYYDMVQNISYGVNSKNGSGTVYSTGTQYVINYAPVLSYISTYAGELSTAFAENSISDYMYGGLSDIFEALDAFTNYTTSPNNYDYDNDVDVAVKIAAYKIKEVVSEYHSTYTPVSDEDGGGNAYIDLIEQLSDADITAQIVLGNDDGEGNVYSTKTWNAFIDAYNTAMVIMYDMADTDYVYRDEVYIAAETLAAAYANLELSQTIVVDTIAENTFTAAEEASVSVNETFNEDKTLKQNVYFKNEVSSTNGYSVYIRALVLISWIDEYGNYVGTTTPSEGTDYHADLNLTDTGWFYCSSDGYYYYRLPVTAGRSTENLINSIYQLSENADGYTLDVQIVAECIQVAGVTDDNVPFVTAYWGCEVFDSSTQAISKA